MLLSRFGLASSLPRSAPGGGVAIRGLPAGGCFASAIACFVVVGIEDRIESEGRVMATGAVVVAGRRLEDSVGGNVMIRVAGGELCSKGPNDDDAALFTLAAKQCSFRRPRLRCAW